MVVSFGEGLLTLGAGLLLLGLGLLAMLLAIVICFKLLPAMVKGIINLFKRPSKK
jgi:tetrahydromethanopterin S-methyltransferase subunit C